MWLIAFFPNKISGQIVFYSQKKSQIKTEQIQVIDFRAKRTGLDWGQLHYEQKHMCYSPIFVYMLLSEFSLSLDCQ